MDEPVIRGGLRTRGRVMLVLVGMATVPALLTGALAYQNATSTLEERINSQLISVADLKEAEIENWIDLVQSDADLLANNFLNEEHITVILDPAAEPSLQADFSHFLTENLESLQNARTGYATVFYMNRQGRVMLSTEADQVGAQADENLAAGVFGSENGRYLVDIHRQEGELRMAFSQVMHEVDPVAMAATDVVNAAVVIYVDVTESLYPILLNWPERGDTGDSYLVQERDGDYTALSPLRFSPAEPLNEPLPPHVQSADIYKAPMSQESAVVEISDYRGEKVLHINRLIEETGWTLVVEKDTSEAFASVRRLANSWALVTVGTLLVAIGVAAVLARNMTSPLIDLTEAVTRVGQGDLRTHVGLERPDEIGQLAGAFNAMVDSLRENARNIQQRGEELQALVNLSATFLGSTDVALALESALHETLAATHGEAATAVLLDADESNLTIEAEIGLSPDLLGSKNRVDRLTAAGYCILESRTIVSQDLGIESRFRCSPSIRSLGAEALMAVPLKIGLRTFGAMVFYCFKPYRFQDDEVNLAQAIANQTAVALERIQLVEDLSISYDRTLSALAAALDARDRETEGHSKRVVAYTLALAKTMKAPEDLLQDIGRGALLHDIGKIGIPDAILHKKGSLSEKEWEIIRKHPEWGKQILEGIPFLEGPSEMVLTHHERWDGQGYPLGISGEEIPIGARLFAVVDAFDAITSTRPYRQASPYSKARQEIMQGRGSQFDPDVVDLFAQFSEGDWLKVLEDYAASDFPIGLRRGTGELDPRQVALADQVQALNHIVEAITSSLNIDDLQTSVLEAVVGETSAVAAGIFLYDPDNGQIRHSADVDLPEELRAVWDQVSLAELADAEVLLEGKSQFYGDWRDAPTFAGSELDTIRPDWLAYSRVPLEGGDQNLGFLVVFSQRPNPFSWEEHALFERVGRLLGQALMNARAHERLRHQAITDALTGAYNRHYLDDFLAIETTRCSRYNRPMALLLLDMDHFKECNDRKGHQAGDQALREVVRILNLGLRTVDMVARYGGEEFVVVLPETGAQGAAEAAERLRRLIENHKFPCGDLSVSIGVVSSSYLEGDHPDPDELFARADKALFRAKQAGRNRLEIWSPD